MSISIEESKKKVLLYEEKEKSLITRKENISKEMAVLESQMSTSLEALKQEFKTDDIDSIKDKIKTLDEEALQLERDLLALEETPNNDR